MASEDCQPKANLFYMVRPRLTQKLETTASSESSLQDTPSGHESMNAENKLSFQVLPGPVGRDPNPSGQNKNNWIFILHEKFWFDLIITIEYCFSDATLHT